MQRALQLMAMALIASAAIGSASAAAAAQGLNIQYHGAGWIQGGRIQHASDTLSDGTDQNFNGNWNQNAGGQITAVADLGGGWEGGLGLGAIQTHIFRGSRPNDKVIGLSWSPYVTEARLSYTVGAPEHPALQITAGSFHFNYNPDVKNLGLYLLRGMVYPGILISGFETRDVLPIANLFGADIRHEAGGYRGDFIVNSETAVNPYFDLSFAYVGSYRFLNAIEVGAGVNGYRALAQRPKITSPGKDCGIAASDYRINAKDREVCFILDTIGAEIGGSLPVVDTVTGSLAGTKLMGRFSIDPKPLFGWDGPFGARDLIFYAEAAVLGLKDYPKYYESIARRIPFMFGVNLPVFGYLDEVSLEMEYYANRNMTDYQKVVEDNSWVPRPRAFNEILDDSGAVIRTERTDTRSDNWKWSLYASKVLAGHLKLSGQVASDHMRTGGYYLQPTQSETLTAPRDWYWMLKMAYYF
jgi:hypothetical protein